MKEVLKYIALIFGFICISLLAICIIQNAITLLFINGWLTDSYTTGECLNFYASLLVGIGTIILGIVTINQTKDANKLSHRLLDKELLDEYCCIQLKPKIDLLIKHNENNKITMSAHHKLDNGATIAIEKTDKEIEKLNEYYIKLYFIDTSNGVIKEIKIQDLLCVQDPLKDGGLYWEDNDDKDPIPCGLHIDFNDSESYRGTSYLPFLGFMVFFAGMMIAFIGIVKISNSRHQWNIFYDERDRKDLKSPAVNKDRKTGIIMLVVGIVMMIVSFLIR